MDVLSMRCKIVGVANAMVSKSSLPHIFLASKLRPKAVRVPPLIKLHYPFRRDVLSRRE